MKILLTIHHPLDPNAGAPGTVLKLGQVYQSLGHEVHYLSYNNLPNRFPGALFPEFAAVYLHQHNRRHRFDIIDASTGDAWIWGTFLRRFAPNQPLLVTHSHGLEHNFHLQVLEEAKRGNLRLSWKYPLYRGSVLLWEVATSLRCADLIFLLNKQDLRYVTEVLGVSAERTHITPNGIPEELLNLPFESLPVSDPSLRIASIGTYISHKGIHYSAPALNEVLTCYPHVSVSFLGTGCSEEQVHADFDVAVRSRIKVIPRFQHDQLPALLKGHAIKLFVSLSEGFGNALIEAMACGLAPVTSAAPGPLEIVNNGHDAVVVPLRDSTAIKQALERLIIDRPYLEQLRRNAYATAQNYSWINAAQKRLTLYENALKKRQCS